MVPPAPVSTMLPDGGMDVDLAPEEPDATDALAGLGHDDDLSGALPDSTLSALAEEVIEGYEADLESNADYRATLTEGLKLLGLKPGQRIDLPFKGASGVVHPLLLEAVVRFYVNAAAELLPAAGPARMLVEGDAAPDTEARARRKQDWLNFHLTKVDRGWLPDARQGIFLTGLYGSTFKKVFRDPKRGHPSSRTLTVWDLVIGYEESSIQDACRITQVEKVMPAELRRLQIAGYYRDVVLSEPTGINDAATDGKPADAEMSTRTEDAPHEVLHQYVLLDLDGLEHADEDGERTGLPLPYIVTVERGSMAVLRLVRNYAADDALFLAQEHFVSYQYLPGLGMYGMGLIHLVGQSADAATTMLRQAINAFTLSSFPGGFKAKGIKAEKSIEAIGPCEFKELDTGGQPIQAVIMPLPYKDVPPSFAPLMQEITSAGQRLGGTADIAVGDGREDAPVGTTIALIEKATRVESEVIKSLHASMAHELQLLADLFGKDQGAKYPYVVNGKRGQAIAADFADNDDIVPVSDPNAPTQTQRLALAEGKLKLAMQAGPLVDKREALMDMYRALGTSDADMTRLMPPQAQAMSGDPVTELQAVMAGKAVQARPDQDHAAHIAVHQTQVAMPGLHGTPLGAHMAAHMAEHVGMLYRAKVGLAMGQPMPPAGPLPPQVEAQITQAVAQVAQQVAASMPGADAHAQPATKPDMGPVEAQLKMLELQTKQASEDRKALQTGKSDEIQIARMNVQSQDQEQAREQKQRDNATGISTALIGAMSQEQSHQHDMARAAVEGTAQVMAEGQQQSTQAVQNRHTEGMALLDAVTTLATHAHQAGQTQADHTDAAKQRRHEKGRSQ